MNMNKHYFLAFDLGATSGRSMLGMLEGDKFEIRELTRFPNAIMELHGKYYWNIDRKSTRLNSSHASISYAVFCLKKKTKK